MYGSTPPGGIASLRFVNQVILDPAAHTVISLRICCCGFKYTGWLPQSKDKKALHVLLLYHLKKKSQMVGKGWRVSESISV